MPVLAKSVSELAQMPEVRACLEWFRRERAWINEQHLALCRIAAPTFFEQKRAEWMAERLQSLGWESKLDRAGNVIASLPGHGSEWQPDTSASFPVPSDAEGFVRLLPHRHGTDGFTAIRLRRGA